MIFDVEGNGLTPTKLHVLAYTEDNQVKHTHDYDKMREVLTSAKTLIGHNIILYDIPVVERILDIKIEAKIIDTLALSWYLQPKKVIHGLDAYGKEFGIEKPPIQDWHNLTPEEYAHRCVEDVKINKRIWKEQKSKLLRLYGDKEQADRLISYLMFKMDCAREQERSGWKLDVDLAQTTYDQLLTEQEEKVEQLKAVMPPVKKYVKKERPKKPFKKDGTWSAVGAKWFNLLKEEGLPEDYDEAVTVFSHEVEPNPNSPEQIKDWLFSLGWKPITFDYKKEADGSERTVPQLRVDNGEGKELCESVFKLAEKEPDIKVLEGLSVIQHRLGIFKGFLENQENGWLKAEIAGFTNTLRFKHRVIVNLPGVSKAYGDRVRGALIAPEGYTLCGSDMVSLEDTTKRHYMWDYDPEYVTEMSAKGYDPHMKLLVISGKITEDEYQFYTSHKSDPASGGEEFARLDKMRSKAKMVNYSALYGVGAAKLARQADMTKKEAKALLDAFWELNWSIKKVADDATVQTVDGQQWILNPVSNLWYSLRNEKDRWSTLNQGTGVFCFDSWIKEFRKTRPQLTAQMHDEAVLCIKQGSEDRCRDLLKGAIGRVNDKLRLNVKLDVDTQFGPRYSDVH